MNRSYAVGFKVGVCNAGLWRANGTIDNYAAPAGSTRDPRKADSIRFIPFGKQASAIGNCDGKTRFELNYHSRFNG